MKVSGVRFDFDPDKTTATELDSHADSPVVGRYCKILEDTGRKATVSGFTSELGKPMTVPVVNAAVAYDCDITGRTLILVICNALYFQNMEENLIPPFMMRLAGIEVDECPKFLAKNPSENNHSMFFPDSSTRIPFLLEGIISYVPTRLPTQKELKDEEGNYLLLTPNMPTWNPHTSIYRDQEFEMTDYNGNVKRQRPDKTVEDDNVYDRSIYGLETAADPRHFISTVRFLREVCIGGLKSVHRKGRVTAQDLATRLKIPIEMAKKTIRATTQLAVRTVEEPSLTRKYQTNDRMLRYPRLSTDTFMDTFFSSKKSGPSYRGFTTCQIFATEFGHVFAVPMEGKSGIKIAQALKRYFKEVGVPSHLICDQAREQVRGDARILCNEAGCHVIELEKGTPAANRAERAIKILKDGVKKDMFEADSPLNLWCYCVERRADIINSTVRTNHLLQNQTPHTKLTAQPTDISRLCEYGWYDWVTYRQEGEAFPYNHQKLGRVLGPAKGAGNEMSQWVLTATGDIMPIQSLRLLNHGEQNSQAMKDRQRAFTNYIKSKLGDSMTPPPPKASDPYPEGIVSPGEIEPDDIVYETYEGWYPDEKPINPLPEADDIPDTYDVYIDAEVLLPQDGKHLQAARVIGRAKDANGKLFGTYHQNPMLNTNVYEVMFPDGGTSRYAANIIAENIYSQVDVDGHRYQLMDHIMNHKTNGHALTQEQAFTVSRNGNKVRRQTTKGWFFQVQWKDGTDSWLPLKELKESHPVQVAEYAQSAQLLDVPAFAWWAPHALKKRDQIIAKVVSRTKKKSHKYGIEVPRDVRHAHELDRVNGNTLWADAIRLEMGEVRVAFDVKQKDTTVRPNYEYLNCYMVFDVKMDFTRKARFVANGAKTKDLTTSTYAGVVSKETVRIAFTYAALNDLDIFAADIKNAYLQAPITEKYWTRCGPEFGPELEGSVAYIVRALYGTKCGGRDFRNHLRECMEMLGYESCLADPDLWIRKSSTDEGIKYYEYMLLYTDDCLAISKTPLESLMEINKYFPMKPKSIGPPKIYLGAKISKVQLPNGTVAFAMSMSQYVKEAVRNVEEHLKKKDLGLLKKASTPIAANYSPEVDGSPELDEEEATYYQSLIGTLRWIVEMGRMDISMEVSALSSFVVMPREGHMQQVLHIFAYLKIHHNARIVFDPSYPEIDNEAFGERNWSSMYGNEKELIPSNAPKALGSEFIIRAYVDASFAGCKLTRRSRTGFIVFLNRAPIFYFSKKQGSCETSTFGSEFVAMKQCCEYIRGLRYKLRMMGIPVNNPAFVYGDNQSVLWNTTDPDSTLKKKSSSVAYHFVREGVAKGEWRTGYVKTTENPSDVMTKVITSKIDRKRKVSMMLYDIYPEVDME